MKRIVLCLLLCILLLPVRGKAEASDPTGFDLSTLAEDTVFLANLDNPSESILGLERHADTKRYPASTTKIMTCILALELAEPDALVTVSKRACNLSERNSKMDLVPGERFTMIDLLYGLMLPSGNDAAIAIAEHIGGSIAGFAALMNEKAEALGMTGTHYVNPHGLHNDAHYTTARDLAVLTAYAMQNETFRSIVATSEYTATSADGRVLELKNANRLLRDIVVTGYEPYSCLYPDAIGVKTGDTHLAGKCLVAAAKRNDTTYVLVLLHGQSAPEKAKGREKDLYAAQRFYDAIALFEYAFEHDTVTVDVGDLCDRCLPETYAIVPDPARTPASEALYRIEWDRSASLDLPHWQADAFLLDPFPESNLCYTIDSYTAPVGEKAGTVTIVLNGEVVFSGDLIVDEYTFPPTPEPTATPYFVVTDETPLASLSPSATPTPEPSWIPVETNAPQKDTGFFSFLRCG